MLCFSYQKLFSFSLTFYVTLILLYIGLLIDF